MHASLLGSAAAACFAALPKAAPEGCVLDMGISGGAKTLCDAVRRVLLPSYQYTTPGTWNMQARAPRSRRDGQTPASTAKREVRYTESSYM